MSTADRLPLVIENELTVGHQKILAGRDRINAILLLLRPHILEQRASLYVLQQSPLKELSCSGGDEVYDKDQPTVHRHPREERL
jgi:hypothetical protein